MTTYNSSAPATSNDKTVTEATPHYGRAHDAYGKETHKSREPHVIPAINTATTNNGDLESPKKPTTSNP